MVAPVFREPAFVWACVALMGGCALAALTLRQRKFLLGLSERFVKLPPSTKAVIVTAVVVATVFAQKPTNVSTNFTDSHGLGEGVSATLNTEDFEERRRGEGRDVLDRIDKIDRIGGDGTDSSNLVDPVNPVKGTPCLSNSVTSAFSDSNLPTLSSNDVVRGYRLETVRTNEADFSKRPTNARLVGTWHLTDAYEAVERMKLDGIRFPLGSHVVTSLWAHTWGKVRPQLRNASNEIVVIGSPMFARHDQSFLWTAAMANGSVVLTWQHFFLGNPYERSLTTDSHGLTRIGDEKPTALNTEKFEERRHGEENTTPCLSSSVTSRPLARPSGSPSAKVPSETLCVSSAHVLSDSNPLVAHPSINAQLELFPNGDFIARSNDIERVYRRVNPDDWDDDGIPNDADDAPLVAADEPQFGPRQTLPEGANADAYCWIDLVVRRANAKVTFAGDGESDLSDPSFIAEADATNRVTLLIGKTYRVTCPMPFEVAGKSSDDIEESWERDGAALWLHWTVSISRKPAALNTEGFEKRRHGAREYVLDRIDKIDRIVEDGASSPPNPVNPVNPVKETPCLPSSSTSVLSAAGLSVFSDSNTPLTSFTLLPIFQTFSKHSKPFTMQVTPAGLGGAFTWTNVCCRVSGSGYTFSITCGDGCSCGGCSATGYLEYEGYRLPAYGGFCGCNGYVDHPGGEGDPDDTPPLPGVSATFSKRVVFFEDEYENAPGETVPWRSTETELDCWAYGGTRGGHVRIEIVGADGLVPYGGSPLPFERDLEPGEEVAFKTTYRAVRPSGGEDDIVVTATFTENETGWTETTVDKATAVKVTVNPKVTAPENESFGRHKYGVREEVSCLYFPSSASVAWQASSGNLQRDGTFICPLVATEDPLTISGGSATYTPSVSVAEPRGIECRNVKAERYGVPVNHAGGIGMIMDLHVLPQDVSFTGIAVEEVPCLEGTHTGYFANPRFSGVWSHTVENGAGNWIDIQEENLFGEDRPAITGELSRVTEDGILVTDVSCGWQDGELVWPIPYGWNERGTQQGADEYGRFGTDTQHRTIIFRNGRSGIRKLQNQVYRDIDGTVNLNGRVVDENE